jgi:hypothetical protein
VATKLPIFDLVQVATQYLFVELSLMTSLRLTTGDDETQITTLDRREYRKSLMTFYRGCCALIDKYRHLSQDLDVGALSRALVANTIDGQRASANLDCAFDIWQHALGAEEAAQHLSVEDIGLARSYGNSISACFGRRFCITHRGQLGLVPPGAKAGDVVAIFNGSQTPFVIRRDGRHFEITGEMAYELVGESYFHRMMDGEMVDDEKEEMITLI